MDSARTIEKIQKLAEKKKTAKVLKYLSASESEVVVAALQALSEIRDEDSVNSIAAMATGQRLFVSSNSRLWEVWVRSMPDPSSA